MIKGASNRLLIMKLVIDEPNRIKNARNTDGKKIENILRLPWGRIRSIDVKLQSEFSILLAHVAEQSDKQVIRKCFRRKIVRMK